VDLALSASAALQVISAGHALDGGAEPLLTEPIDFAALRGEIEMRLERAA